MEEDNRPKLEDSPIIKLFIFLLVIGCIIYFFSDLVGLEWAVHILELIEKITR